MPFISGGASLTLDDVLVMLFGSEYTGSSVNAGDGIRYLLAQKLNEAN
jgi:hypothetical protein